MKVKLGMKTIGYEPTGIHNMLFVSYPKIDTGREYIGGENSKLEAMQTILTELDNCVEQLSKVRNQIVREKMKLEKENKQLDLF